VGCSLEQAIVNWWRQGVTVSGCAFCLRLVVVQLEDVQAFVFEGEVPALGLDGLTNMVHNGRVVEDDSISGRWRAPNLGTNLGPLGFILSLFHF